MSKDAYYFPHDANARSDPKILSMRSQFGAEGYGWYWIIVEMLREQKDYKLPLKKHTWNALAMQMQCDCNAAQCYVDACINEHELFVSDGEFFWSETLIRRMQQYTEKSEKARKAAKARWAKSSNDKESEQTQCDRNANAMQTQCDRNASKVNKSKVNKSINNNNKSHTEIIKDYTNNDALISALKDFAEMRKKIKKPLTDRALTLLLKKLDRLADDDDKKIKILEQSIFHNWQGIFELKNNIADINRYRNEGNTNEYGSRNTTNVDPLDAKYI